MGLPDFSGDHVARELRALNPSLPILICTGYDSARVSEEIKTLGVCIVEKPIDEPALISTLRQHMRVGQSISSVSEPARLRSPDFTD